MRLKITSVITCIVYYSKSKSSLFQSSVPIFIMNIASVLKALHSNSEHLASFWIIAPFFLYLDGLIGFCPLNIIILPKPFH